MADKKKIGIAAVTYKENFGSALQTYATQYTLEKMGYDARIFEIKVCIVKYTSRSCSIMQDACSILWS